MNNLRVWFGIGFLLLTNIFVLSTRNVLVLIPLLISVYLYGYFVQSKRQAIRRLRTFALIGLSLLFFQIIVNQSVPWEERALHALRITFQLAIISQLTLVLVRYISLSGLVAALGFLPRTWQLLIAMTFAFIPLLVQEQDTIQIVQRSRGLGLSWRSRLLAPFAFFVPLMHRILQRSETIGLTMVARGFVE